MRRGPFDIKVASKADGLCDLEITVQAKAVQAAFDKIFAGAVARAQSDPEWRKRANLPEGEAISAEKVLEADLDNIGKSLRQSMAEWALGEAVSALEIKLARSPAVHVGMLIPRKRLINPRPVRASAGSAQRRLGRLCRPAQRPRSDRRLGGVRLPRSGPNERIGLR
jgi:hypothetical protein